MSFCSPAKKKSWFKFWKQFVMMEAEIIRGSAKPSLSKQACFVAVLT